jgi:hypothetical protein
MGFRDSEVERVGAKSFLIPALKTALLRYNERGKGNSHGLVFCTKTGKPYDRSTLREKLNAVN